MAGNRKRSGTSDLERTSRTPSEVHVHRAEDYASLGPLMSAALGGLSLAGKRVLLKVNLMKGQAPAKATNTHPEFVAAAVRAVKELGGHPLVGDSSGALGLTRAGFVASGIAEAVERSGGRWLSFDAAELVKFIVGGLIGETFIPKEVLDCEVRITLPKLKTHTLFGLSGAVKNQLGLLPGALKPELHARLGGRVDLLAQAIVELNLAVPFQLAIVDGILALEGGGSSSGQPCQRGLVAWASDLVALDAALCELAGLDPQSVPTNPAGEKLGLGTMSYRLVGEKVSPAPLRKPGFDLKRFPPLGRLAYRLRAEALSLRWDAKLCTHCGKCTTVCPTSAVERSGSTLSICAEKCTLCYSCVENCEPAAISLRPRWYARSAYRKRAAGTLVEQGEDR